MENLNINDSIAINWIDYTIVWMDDYWIHCIEWYKNSPEDIVFFTWDKVESTLLQDEIDNQVSFAIEYNKELQDVANY
jgi:hypothetical protein